MGESCGLSCSNGNPTPANVPRRQHTVASVLGPLPPMWEIQMDFLAPGLSLPSHHQSLQSLGTSSWRLYLSLPLFLKFCLSNKYVYILQLLMEWFLHGHWRVA